MIKIYNRTVQFYKFLKSLQYRYFQNLQPLQKIVMQKQVLSTQCSKPLEMTYMQNFIKQKNESSGPHENYAFMKILIGKFLIQAYRIFKYFPEENSIILFKRQQNKTHYLFFHVVQSLRCIQTDSQYLTDAGKNPIKKMRGSIEKILKKPLQNYTVGVALVKQIKKLTFLSEDQFIEFVNYCKNEENLQMLSNYVNSSPFKKIPQQIGQKLSLQKVQCYAPYFSKEHEQVLFQTNQQIEDLKQMITTYIDTFGNQQKGSLIYKLIQKSTASFSINILLNTINYIIFQQLNGSCYSQIQPCYWTCYEASKGGLRCDRKHIVLSGSGQVCVLQIILMREIKSQNKDDYSMMYAQFRKFFKKSKIKIFRITNEKWNGSSQRINLEDDQNDRIVSSSNPYLIYKFYSTVVQQPRFPR